MIKKVFLLLCALASFGISHAQKTDSVYQKVEVMPEFPGGENKLYEFLAANIEYPRIARENGIAGTVYAVFVINKNGSIANAKIVRDIGGGCGAAVLKVVKQMPKWTSGRLGDKPVRVEYTLPVSFEEIKDEKQEKKLSKKELRTLRKIERKQNRKSK